MSREDLYGTFNMGVGMVLAVSPNKKDQVLDKVQDAFVLGQVTDEKDEKLVLK